MIPFVRTGGILFQSNRGGSQIDRTCLKLEMYFNADSFNNKFLVMTPFGANNDRVTCLNGVDLAFLVCKCNYCQVCCVRVFLSERFVFDFSICSLSVDISRTPSSKKCTLSLGSTVFMTHNL